MPLDWSFYSWDLIQKYILNGFLFSIELTVIATIRSEERRVGKEC